MKTKKQLYIFIKKKDFFLKTISLVEKHVGANFISIRNYQFAKNIKTIREYVAKIESDKSQQTGKTTVLLAADFEEAVKEVLASEGFEIVEDKLCENGEERSDAGVRVLDSDGKVIIIHFEIKATQTENAFQGATHGLKKVPRYLLFNFTVDMDYKLPPISSPNRDSLYGFITHAYCAFHDGKLVWEGEASETNSRTTAKIPGSVSDSTHHAAIGQIEKMSRNICRTAKEGRTIGKQWVRPASILHRHSLNKHRNKQNILEVNECSTK